MKIILPTQNNQCVKSSYLVQRDRLLDTFFISNKYIFILFSVTGLERIFMKMSKAWKMWHAGKTEVDILRKYRQKRLNKNGKKQTFFIKKQWIIELYVES